MSSPSRSGRGGTVVAPPPIRGDDTVLLLSGGMDSTALAAWVQPAAALFIDYGQGPAVAEERAARAVARAMHIPFDMLRVDLRPLGSGLLLDEHGKTPTRAHALAPSPEWWPLRNQLLCSLAAAWALGSRVPQGVHIRNVITATVGTDGTRHIDGTPAFYEALDFVTRMQEGEIRVLAPVATMDPEQLLVNSGITEEVLAWSHSCHRSSLPCADCPGCWKREQLLEKVKLLGFPCTVRESSAPDA